MDPHRFRADLLAHYDRHKRAMPWRETRDPYAILVSELMLQQTQVQTVIPYYTRFLARFPTPADLAAAPEEELLKLWQGLGYYRRARNLQAAAARITAHHGGVFPTDKADIDALPGVGPYTSAAVASIALGQAHACVDGNVVRVIARLDASDADVGTPAEKRRIADRAETLLDRRRPGDFNQAMMELGATVCTPRNPGCLTCPVRPYCRTAARGDNPHLRPVKSKRAAPATAHLHAVFLFESGPEAAFVLGRRPDTGLMAGMWELPAADDAPPGWATRLPGAEHLGTLPPMTHRFTHLHATYDVGLYRVPRLPQALPTRDGYAELRTVGFADLKSLPLTRVTTKLLPTLEQTLQGDLPCLPDASTLPGWPTTP